MSPQKEIIDKIINIVNSLDLFDKLTIDPLPATKGISMEITAGYDDSVYYSKNREHVITLLFLCKNSSQSIAFGTLCNIGNYLQTQQKYPVFLSQSNIRKIEVTSDSQFVSKEENNTYIYSMVVNVTAYF